MRPRAALGLACAALGLSLLRCSSGAAAGEDGDHPGAGAPGTPSAPDAADDESGLDASAALDGTDAPTAPAHPAVNAVILADGSLLPIYEVRAPGPPQTKVGLLRAGASLTLLRHDRKVLWTRDVGEGELFGGFDFDADGYPDFGVARRTPTGEICGATPTVTTHVELYAGATAAMAYASPAEKDLCWTFPSATYPTSQWTSLDVLFGASTKTLALSAYYATTGEMRDVGASSAHAFDYPSTSAFGGYAASRTNAYGSTKEIANSHVANGLFVSASPGVTRLVFFTSARVLQYAIGPRSSSQLVADHPFLSGGRTDIAGRNYGLVATDPAAPSRVWLLAGTAVQTVHADLEAATMTADPWGQIERHLTSYETATDTLDDRFFSYAHDNADGNKYEGRLAYPASPFVRLASGPSRVAYNVYSGGHWYLHVSQPGKTTDDLAIRGQLLWDIRDLDGDGVDEWVLSPVELPTDPDVAGYYFPKRETYLAHWNEGARSLAEIARYPGRVPELAPTFRLPARTTSMGYLYPALTVEQPPGRSALVLRGPSGREIVALP